MELSRPAERLGAQMLMPQLPRGPLDEAPTPQPTCGVPTLPGAAFEPPPPFEPQPITGRPASTVRLAAWTPVFEDSPAIEPVIAPAPAEHPAELTPPELTPPAVSAHAAAPLADTAFSTTTLLDSVHPDAALPDTALPDAVHPDAALPATALPDAMLPDAAVGEAAFADSVEPASARTAHRGPTPMVVAIVVAVLALVALAVQSSRTEFVPDDVETPSLANQASAAGATNSASLALAPESAAATGESLQAASDGWLAWAAASPAATHPLLDTTGEHCGVNQTVPGVFFLAGSFGETVERVCQVPAGRVLVVPAINAWCDPANVACGDSVRTATTSITLDGVEQPTFLRDAMALDIDAVAGNPIVAVDGSTQLTMSGEWAAIGPLATGSHTLRIRASTGQFALDVRYLLVVG